MIKGLDSPPQLVAWCLLLTFPCLLPNPAYSQQNDDLFDDLFGDDSLDSLLEGDEWTGTEVPRADEPSVLRSWKGSMELKPRVYLRDRDKGLNDEQFIMRAEFEMDFQFGAGRSAFFRPRIYVDLADGETNRFDPFEAYATLERSNWDLRAGQFVENWGIADTYNPIDIINRRDLATSFLDTDRLGEIGLRYRYFGRDKGAFGEPTISVYALPIWQPTRFPGADDRFGFGGSAQEFDEDRGFEPTGLERGLYAAHFKSTLTTAPFNADLQILAARGPGRMPGIALNRAGNLAPAYFGVTTTGLGLRAVPNRDVLGEFLSTLTLKAEIIHAAPYRLDNTPFEAPDSYWSFVLGVDRSFNDLFRGQDSLTLTAEYAGESGAKDPTTQLRLFQNDVILRGIWEANDFARSSFEMRGVFDMELPESIFEAVFERQLRGWHEDLKLTLQFQHFRAAANGESLLGYFPDNTALAIGLRWDY